MLATGQTLAKLHFDAPDETRPFPHGKAEILKAGAATLMLATFQPGWRWSTAVKPMVETASCQVPHLNYVLSGRIKIAMDDGSEEEFGPGDVAIIPPGHDAWVVGDEPWIALDIIAGPQYAKPA